MAPRSKFRRWQIFLVLGLIACIVSFYIRIGDGAFTRTVTLVTLCIGLLNAFLSPAKTKPDENWFVSWLKRTIAVGKYAKAICVAAWIVALLNLLPLAIDARNRSFQT